MRDEVGIEQVEAMIRLAGVRDEMAVEGILDIVREYADATRRKRETESGEESMRAMMRNGRGETVMKAAAWASVPDSMKMCAACGNVLDLVDFYKDAARPDGLQSACKECKRVQRQRRLRRLSAARRAARAGATVTPSFFVAT